MSRGIDNVYLGILICNGSVLGQNGDTALTLDIAGVHDTLRNFLILSEHAALFEQLIHKRGLAVVYMRYDRNISDIFSGGDHFILLSKP